MSLRDLIAAAIAAGKPAPQWLGQHYATPERKARRALVKSVGRRQARKQLHA